MLGKLLKRLPVVVMCLLIGIVAAIGVSAQSTTTPKPDAAGLLQEFNRWRTAIGIRPYQEDARLSASAQFHADDMANRNYFAHTARSPIACNGLNVSQPHERAACFDTMDRGEGIYTGRTSPDEATRGWISSYGHCLGVMNPTATHLGGGNNDVLWVFQFNGVNEPEPAIQSESFCNCTKGNNSEEHIQACVTNFNNQFNNGITPPVPPPSQLQITARIPQDKNVTYNNRTNGGQSFGKFGKGTLTISVVPVTGNPSGIPIELADGNFDRIPGQTANDTLTYQVTEPGEFSIWFDGTKQAAGDSFYFDVLWVADYVSPTNQSAVPVEAIPVIESQPVGCSVGDGVEMMLTIINNSNEPVSLHWVDFECGEADYGTIDPQTTYDQGTFNGHEWVVRNAAGEAIDYLLASPDNALIVIDSATSLADEMAEEGVYTADEPLPDAPSQGAGDPVAIVDIPSNEVCSVVVTTFEELVKAINDANDEALCPGLDNIFVFEDIVVNASYDGGPNAFPPITSNITISSMTRMIMRTEDAPDFRFFYVDGSMGHVTFALENIHLVNGRAGNLEAIDERNAIDGGAILVDASNGGKASLHTRSVSFRDNYAKGNGGAVSTFSMHGGEVDAIFMNGSFIGNTADYGGAFYSGGFDGGQAGAIIDGVNFDRNNAMIQGGTLYNNGLGADGYAEMSVSASHLTESSAPKGETVFNNGVASGNAILNFIGRDPDTSGTLVGTHTIINAGNDGYASMSWNGHIVGDPTAYTCASNVGVIVDCQ